MKTFKSINPFDQSVIEEYELITDQQLDDSLAKAELAFLHWRKFFLLIGKKKLMCVIFRAVFTSLKYPNGSLREKLKTSLPAPPEKSGSG